MLHPLRLGDEQDEVASRYVEVDKLELVAEWSLVATLRESASMDVTPMAV